MKKTLLSAAVAGIVAANTAGFAGTKIDKSITDALKVPEGAMLVATIQMLDGKMILATSDYEELSFDPEKDADVTIAIMFFDEKEQKLLFQHSISSLDDSAIATEKLITLTPEKEYGKLLVSSEPLDNGTSVASCKIVSDGSTLYATDMEDKIIDLDGFTGQKISIAASTTLFKPVNHDILAATSQKQTSA